jgi:hypothetical protein
VAESSLPLANNPNLEAIINDKPGKLKEIQRLWVSFDIMDD